MKPLKLTGFLEYRHKHLYVPIQDHFSLKVSSAANTVAISVTAVLDKLANLRIEVDE